MAAVVCLLVAEKVVVRVGLLVAEQLMTVEVFVFVIGVVVEVLVVVLLVAVEVIELVVVVIELVVVT